MLFQELFPCFALQEQFKAQTGNPYILKIGLWGRINVLISILAVLFLEKLPLCRVL